MEMPQLNMISMAHSKYHWINIMIMKCLKTIQLLLIMMIKCFKNHLKSQINSILALKKVYYNLLRSRLHPLRSSLHNKLLHQNLRRSIMRWDPIHAKKQRIYQILLFLLLRMVCIKDLLN